MSSDDVDSFVSRISIYKQGKNNGKDKGYRGTSVRFKTNPEYFCYGLATDGEFFIYESDQECRKALISQGFSILDSKAFTMAEAYVQLELDEED